MTSSGTLSKLAIILTVNLFIQLHTADAGIIPSVQSIQYEIQHEVEKFISTLCLNVGSEPALICDKTIDFFATKVKDEISLVSKLFCNSSLTNIKSLFPTSNIENLALKLAAEKVLRSLDENCQTAANEMADSLIDRVRNPLKKACADVVEYIPEEMRGNKPSFCFGMPTLAKNECPNIVNTGCGEIGTEQPDLRKLIPFCKDNLSKVVCAGDWSSAFQSIGEIVNKLEPSTTTTKPIKTKTNYRPRKPSLVQHVISHGRALEHEHRYSDTSA